MHKLIRTFASIVGVLVVASLVLVVLLTTETGTCWLIHHVATHVPGQLTIRRIQGSVFSDLSLYGVDYRTDQQHTEIQHVALSWQPIALLSGTVHLQNLDIQGITCILLEPKETSTKGTVYLSPDASFPLEVVIEEARLDRLDLRHGDSRYVLDYVHLTGRADRNGLWFDGPLWSQTLATAGTMALYAFRMLNGYDDDGDLDHEGEDVKTDEDEEVE